MTAPSTTIEEWITKLENSALPALRQSVEQLKRLSADENVPVSNLSDVIERDPALAVCLLRTINSMQHKHLGNEVTTVEHGLMMLGLSQIGQLPGKASQLESIESSQVRLGLLRCFSRAFHAAFHAYEWARLRKDIEPAEVYIAALLHNLAEMALWPHIPQQLEQIRQLIRQRDMEPEEAEYVVLGFGLNELSMALAKRWGLPLLLIQSLQPENADRPRPLGVMLATQLAREVELGWYRQPVLDLIEQIADYLYFDPNELPGRIHRDAVRAARQSELYGVMPAAFRLLSPVVPDPLAETVEEKPNVASQAPQADFCLTPRLDVIHAVIDDLAAHMDDTLTLHDALERTLHGLHEGVGLNRVVFAILSNDKKLLKARAIVGSDNDPHFNRFTIDLESENLFSMLLKKPQALWFNLDNRHKLAPLLPKGFHEAVRSEEFFVISVIVKGKPVGLFYADRHTSACRLDAPSYERFKQITLQAIKTFGHLADANSQGMG